MNALAYVATEVHPSVAIFFYPQSSSDVQNFIKERANKKLDYLQKTLIGDKKYLVGNKLSIADIYLFIVLSWIQHFGGALDLSAYQNVKNFFEHIGSLDGVKAAQGRMATNPASTI